MNANAMKTRLDQTKTRQPDTEGGTVVTRTCMTALLSNKVFGVDRQLPHYKECHHHQQVQRIVADMKKDQTRTRQTGGGGWHCGHALGSNSPPLLHCITLHQYLAWHVYSLWSVHNHLTGYWFTLTKRACIPLGKNLCDSFKYRGNHGNENCKMKGKIFSHFESETTETWVFWKKNAAKACHWFPESGHLWLWSEIKSHFTSASLIPACIQDSFLVGQPELLERFAEKYMYLKIITQQLKEKYNSAKLDKRHEETNAQFLSDQIRSNQEIYSGFTCYQYHIMMTMWKQLKGTTGNKIICSLLLHPEVVLCSRNGSTMQKKDTFYCYLSG